MSSQSHDASVWKSEELTRAFLSGVRGAIPLASEQLAILVRLVESARPKLGSFLDLGCGDGILGAALASRFPQARGVFVDFSRPMLDAARARFGANSNHCRFIEADYSAPQWRDTVFGEAPFDAIVSGFSIHHQPDGRKREIYAEIFGLLKPAGIFLNLEHVSSSSRWVEQNFDELFVDSICAHHRAGGGTKTRQELATEYYHRPDKAANILAPVEKQCEWLREIGYTDVDCYLKIFELALFGGIRS
jgi:ubiquinone/menaquinone biosynthesis C-methylase UbiE